MTEQFPGQAGGHSREYIEQLFGLLSTNGGDKTAIISLHRALVSCDDYTFNDCLLSRPERWSSIFGAIKDIKKDEEIVATADFFFRKGASVLASKGNYSSSLKSFCTAVHTNHIVATVVAPFMWPHCDANMEIKVIMSIAAFLDCLMLLNQHEPQNTDALLCDTYLSLKTGGFFTLLTTVLESGPHHERQVEKVALQCALNLSNIDREMYARSVDKLPSYLMRNLIDLLNKHFKINEWDSNSGYSPVSESGKHLSHLSLINAMDLISFSTDSNLSFRKKYLERLLFEDDAFPIVKALAWLSDQLSQCFSAQLREDEPSIFILQCFLNKDILIFNLIDKLMELWIESHAQSFDDLRSVLQTFKVAFFQRDTFLGAKEPDVGACLVNIRSLTYDDLKTLQLTQIRKTHSKKWEKQIAQFDTMLSNQVIEYVRHQRLLQLQKGAWVYSENPLDVNVKQPKVFFLALSDNQMNLLAREFKIRSDECPSIQGNEIMTHADSPTAKSKTIVIPLRRINKFQHWRVQSESKVPENAKLINILNKAIYTEIHLLDKDTTKLLRYFLDTKEASYIWLDGLQLIVASAQGKKPALSEEVKSQISTLVDLRKNVQIIGLDDRTKLGIEEEDSDVEEQYYDIATLQALTADFHYD